MNEHRSWFERLLGRFVTAHDATRICWVSFFSSERQPESRAEKIRRRMMERLSPNAAGPLPRETRAEYTTSRCDTCEVAFMPTPGVDSSICTACRRERDQLSGPQWGVTPVTLSDKVLGFKDRRSA